LTAVNYYTIRLVADQRRGALWQSLWRYRFCASVEPTDCDLERGAGYCDFIITVVARWRTAIGAWEDFLAHLASGIEHWVGSVTDLGFLDVGTVDFAFASNLFEHLTEEHFARQSTH
jgi:hypothetical protein